MFECLWFHHAQTDSDETWHIHNLCPEIAYNASCYLGTKRATLTKASIVNKCQSNCLFNNNEVFFFHKYVACYTMGYLTRL